MAEPNDIAIKIDGISKTFKLPHEKTTSIKSALINGWRKSRTYEKQEALKDISFEIKKGEFFGIVGRNGSGKSTLLKLLAGIYTPSQGSIQVNGTLTPFIELGVGFNPELTGRENVFLNGALLGFNRKQMQAMYDDIVEFAELERFMDQKLKNYSSGMQVRLAFSIAIRSKSDILLIDEVLAVGDLPFQEKSYEVFRNIKKEGRTVVFVSHDLGSVMEFCDKVAIIDRSKLIEVGSTNDTIMRYGAIVAEEQQKVATAVKKPTNRPGTGAYEITQVDLIDAAGKKINHLKDKQPFTIRITYKAHKEVDSLVCGIAIENIGGISIMGPNTEEAKVEMKPLKPGQKGVVSAKFDPNLLAAGTYHVTVGLFNKGSIISYDFFSQAKTFKVIGAMLHGVLNITPDWVVKEIDAA